MILAMFTVLVIALAALAVIANLPGFRANAPEFARVILGAGAVALVATVVALWSRALRK